MSSNNYQNNKSSHILNAASNLVGFSFIILTTIKVIDPQSLTLVDEIAAALVLLFSASILLSFMSMRSTTEHASVLYEKIADYIFFTGLALLSIVAILLTFTLIQ